MLSTALKEPTLVSSILLDAQTKRQSILKQVSSEPLPESFHSFMLEYEKHFKPRNRFLWQWLWTLLKNGEDGFMLSSVPAQRVHLCGEIKLLLTLAVTIVDDTADNNKDRRLLEVLLQTPSRDPNYGRQLDEKDYPRAALLQSIFDYAENIFKPMPYWDMYANIYEFDVKQVWNACHYAYVLNRTPAILNYSEAMRFSAFNMMVFLYMDTDILLSEPFDDREIGAIREIVLLTQEMARIGNWISTWEREVNESDLSSGVFAKIVTDGHLTVDKLEGLLQNSDTSTLLMVIKESLIENKLLVEWEELRENALKLAKNVKSVDMVRYVKGFDRVLLYHLISTGYK